MPQTGEKWRPGRAKKAPNRRVGNRYFYQACVPQGSQVTNPDDPGVPGYGEQAKYTRRMWERNDPGTSDAKPDP